MLRIGVCDTFESGVWEPTINKRNSLRSATEAACLILSIDETVKNPQVCVPLPSSAHMIIPLQIETLKRTYDIHISGVAFILRV